MSELYLANPGRYDSMLYRRSGKSGVMLSAMSLGLWHNFGDVDRYDNSRQMVLTAFDNGICSMDLANNYGPPPGSAEETFGRIMQQDLRSHRDELFISTKAGHLMWPGPYGEWGSRKSLLASLDQSLRRMKLDYVDIFYSHRYDPNTPVEETVGALIHAVKSGKALYAGISKYPVDVAEKAFTLLREAGVPCLLHQLRYSMLIRDAENGLFDLHRKEGVGCISFSPLAQGVLTEKYLHGIPENSRAAKESGFLQVEQVLPLVGKVQKLHDIAAERGQTLAQMAIAWQLTDDRITTVLIGASSPAQILENLKALNNTSFTDEELKRINKILDEPPFWNAGA
ncbi:MAG: aldo/keto reductase [Bacteroidota bacterium]|nr:aldo/keto reductase [Bacteroidota bacterium]